VRNPVHSNERRARDTKSDMLTEKGMAASPAFDLAFLLVIGQLRKIGVDPLGARVSRINKTILERDNFGESIRECLRECLRASSPHNVVIVFVAMSLPAIILSTHVNAFLTCDLFEHTSCFIRIYRHAWNP
jgi:hypothetical protein